MSQLRAKDFSALVEQFLGQKCDLFHLVKQSSHQSVWFVMSGPDKYAFRFGENQNELQKNFEVLGEIADLNLAPKPIVIKDGWSLETWIESVPGYMKRQEGGVSLLQLKEIRSLLERFHVLKPDELAASVKESLFNDFSSYFQTARKKYNPAMVAWLEEHFPKVQQPICVHGAFNMFNLVYAESQLFMVDFCESVIAEKEMDVGSLYFSEKPSFNVLEEVFGDSGYDLKKILYYSIFYNVRGLGKKREESHPQLLRRLTILMGEYEALSI